jgi:hypothetical protein
MECREKMLFGREKKGIFANKKGGERTYANST